MRKKKQDAILFEIVTKIQYPKKVQHNHNNNNIIHLQYTTDHRL